MVDGDAGARLLREDSAINRVVITGGSISPSLNTLPVSTIDATNGGNIALSLVIVALDLPSRIMKQAQRVPAWVLTVLIHLEVL